MYIKVQNFSLVIYTAFQYHGVPLVHREGGKQGGKKREVQGEKPIFFVVLHESVCYLEF